MSNEHSSDFAENKISVFCKWFQAAIPQRPSAFQHPKSQPRNGAREIFALTVAEITRETVSAANLAARGRRKAAQIGRKMSLAKTANTTVISIT